MKTPNDEAAGFCPVVVILGAGASSRMGRPKLLLPWEGTTLIGHHLGVWRSLPVGAVAVVLAKGHRDLVRELEKHGLDERWRIVNPAPETGMYGSIQCAARWGGWPEEGSHWVIVLGDQPQVLRETLSGLLAFARKHPERVCQPALKGRPRHPVVLPASVFRRLGEGPHTHLKAFLEELDPPRMCWETDDEGLDIDLDTPEDYERARRFLSVRQTSG
jgi:molybdenum cofactor cytidylyltransferase